MDVKGSVNISITQPTLIKDTITSQTNEACYGNTNGRVTIGVTGGNGGYTYSWAPSRCTQRVELAVPEPTLLQ